MDENTWRLAQLLMWVIGIQATFLVACIGFTWSNLSNILDKIEDKIKDIDRRMLAIETILHMKECCMLKDDKQMKKTG